ncbi:MAG TPA: ATP-binding protein [Ktedonobacteraceae bacterium]|nr:ATP-binding protein [Ktedonobacteraceae bacterium]
MRLTLGYTAIFGLILLIFAAVSYGLLAHSMDAALNTTLNDLAVRLASTYHSSDGQIHWQEFPPPNRTTNGNWLLGACGIMILINSQGNVVQTYGPLTSSAIAQIKALEQTNAAVNSYLDYSITTTPACAQARIQYRILATPVRNNGQVVATLLVGISLQQIDNGKELLFRIILAAMLITLIVAIFTGYRMAVKATNPIRAITRAANEISETGLSRRLHLKSEDELGELAATFDHMLDRLEVAFARQRQFTADASHELRTPLTVVNLEVNRALSRRRSLEEYERALAIVQAENEHMTRLVNDLLMLARADAGQTIFKLEAVDLSDLAIEVIERLTPMAQQEQIVLAPGELPELQVRGDRSYLTRMLTNVVENAIKYTRGTGDRVCIATRESSKGAKGWGIIQVADNGPGIAAEHLPYLFDRFYRADEARHAAEKVPLASQREESGGSGLGLSIAQWIAQAHGGNIKVYSTPASGSTFELWLPLQQSQDHIPLVSDDCS